MIGRTVSAALSALLAAGCFSYPPGEARLLTGPYLQDLRHDAVTVMWEAGAGTPSRLSWREVAGGTWHHASIHARTMKVNYVEMRSGLSRRETHVLYSATVEDLEPGTSYEYALHFDNEPPRTGRFRTLAPPRHSFRFAVYGDSRSRPAVHGEVCDAILKTDPTFVIHTGDLVQDGRYYPDWERNFFGPGRDLLMNVPVFPVLGNHEENARFYYDYFQLPSPKEYYWSFNCGDVHFVAIDPLQDWSSSSRQVKWLREDLAKSDARWNVVVVHYPPFSRSSGHYSDRRTRDVLQPVLAEGKVDVLLAGHNHVYERTHPIAEGLGDDGRRIPQEALRLVPHVVTGGGGAHLYNVEPLWWTAAWKATPHFCLFDVADGRMTMRVLEPSGVEIDRFELTKDAGGRSVELLRDVVYCEEIRLDESLRKSIGRTRFPTVREGEAASFDLTFGLSKNYPVDIDVSLSWDTTGTGWTVTPPILDFTLGGAVNVEFHFALDPTRPADRPTLKVRTRTPLTDRTVEIPLR